MTESPVRLYANATDDTVSILVEAVAETAFVGSFTLEVMVGSNRSSHGASVMLPVGEHRRLSDISVSRCASADWNAVLRVQPAAGPAYEQRVGST